MDSDLRKLAKAASLGRQTKRTIVQNITFAIVTKLILTAAAMAVAVQATTA